MIVSGERRIDYSEIHERILRIATGLDELGARNGKPVAMMLRNDFALFEAVQAASVLGSSIIPINWHLKGEEVKYILADSGAGILIVHADLLAQIVGQLPTDLVLLIVETPPEIAAAYGIRADARKVPDDRIDWDVWRAGCPVWEGQPVGSAPMFYTSGTTGQPKGVHRKTMTSEKLAAASRVASMAFGLHADQHATVLINGPMYHSAPHSYGMAAFRIEMSLVLQPRFDPEELLQLIERHRITHMHLVPTMFVRLLRLPLRVRERYDLSSLRFVVHGAAPCPPDVKRAMIDWWGNVINEYFGSTETGIPVWHSAAEALAKPGTVGRVIEGGIVKIFRPDGTLCDVDEPGEIFMRQTASADFDYHGKAEARAEVDREGLISVGDMGYLDDDGYLFLCDRKRDMVISGGVNIYPAEIENVLIGMTGVQDCAVFGVPDDEYGERLLACIALDAAVSLSAQAVRDFVRERLADFKVPKDVIFLDALPREATGKLFKRKLKDLYLSGQLVPDPVGDVARPRVSMPFSARLIP